MATYNNFSDVVDNAEFKEFIKSEFGIDDVAKISSIEQQALLMSFRVKMNDGDAFAEAVSLEADKESADIREQLTEEILKKTYDKVSSAQAVYINYLHVSNPNMDLDEGVKAIKEARNTVKEDTPLAWNNLSKGVNPFDELVAESEVHITQQEPEKVRPLIRDFLEQKESYLQSHPEERDDINKYIDSALVHKEADDQFTISKYFRIAYGEEQTGFYAQRAMSKDDILKAFDTLVIESEGHITQQEPEKVKPLIRDFLEQKESYLQSHPEERDDINKYIDSALVHKEADDQFTISEYFRIAYGEEQTGFINELNDNNRGGPTPSGGRGNGGNDDNTGGPNPPLSIGGISGPEKEQPTHTPGGKDNGGGGIVGTGSQQYKEVDTREFEDNSDKNEARYDRLKYDILVEMGKIKNPLSAEDLKDQTKVYEASQDAIMSLSDKESKEFNVKYADKIVESAQNEQTLATLPPTVLTQVYKYYGEEIAKTKDEEAKNALTAKRDVIAKRMDRLTDEYYTGVRNIVRDNFNFDDTVNIADVHDGYKEMFETRRPDVDERQQAKIDAVDKKLDRDIAEYDNERGITDITKDNVSQVRKNHQELTKRFENIELDKETMQFLNNVQFYDESGKSIPQFVNSENGQPALQWQEGFTIAPDSQLQTMVDFARNNTIIENMASDVKELSDEDLRTALQDRLKVQAFSWATAEEVTKDAIIEPDRFTDEKYLEEFKTRMMDPNRPLKMSAEGFKAATQLSVNDTMGIISRVAGKDHIDNPKDALLKRMYAPIEKYDARKGTRFDQREEYNVNWFKTAGWTFGASLGQKLLTYGATLGCVKAASALGLTTLQTGAAMTKYLPIVTSVTAMTMAGIGAYMNWKNYKKEAKANGKKPNAREFFTKRPYATTNVASALGFAAGACLMTGNLPAAMALGAGCLTVAGYGTYKDAREHGLTKKKALLQSLKKVSAIAVGGGLGTVLGSYMGINPSWNDPGKTIPGNTVAGPDSHNYSAIEHQHAAGRLDDPRFSEFLGRFHVAHELQDSSDPNKVSADAITNLKAAITQAIGDDRRFYTDTANSPTNPHYIPNTDILAYKFEQLAYLERFPDSPIDAGLGKELHIPAGMTKGEYLSIKMPDGSTMHYMDALKEVVSTGKSSNPAGFAELLGKIDEVIGMQIDEKTNDSQVENLVNDAGKSRLSGTGPAASPVQSFKVDADPGYDLGQHQTVTPDQPGEDIIHPATKLFGFGYWEPVKALSGLKKRIGAVADRILGRKVPVDVPPVVEDTGGKKPYVTPKVTIKIPEEKKYIDEEYWMVHGYNPCVREVKDKNGKPVRDTDGKIKTMEINPMLDPGYKAYVENVERERVAAGGKPMLEFLQGRRSRIDGIVEKQIKGFHGSYAERCNADILDPVGYKEVLQKQAQLKAEGKTMTKDEIKDEIDKAIKWPTPEELKNDYDKHRPTSKMIKIIRDSFWRKDNGVEVNNPQQRSVAGGNKKVFSFNDFTTSAGETLSRSSDETKRDSAKAPVRRWIDAAGEVRRTNNL